MKKMLLGLLMRDHGEVDDKLIAVLKNDATYGEYRDISQVLDGIIKSLTHYFLTYKQIPDEAGPKKVEIAQVYGQKEAHEVISAGVKDYQITFNT